MAIVPEPTIRPVKHSSIRTNVTTDHKRPECPSVREIMKENAQLRTDVAILENRLKTYEALYGRIA